jgi:hypothetical protein
MDSITFLGLWGMLDRRQLLGVRLALRRIAMRLSPYRTITKFPFTDRLSVYPENFCSIHEIAKSHEANFCTNL